MRITDGATPVATPEPHTSTAGPTGSKTQPSSSEPQTSTSSIIHAFPYLSNLGTRVNLSGVSVTSQSTGSFSRTSPDFELSRTTSINFVSPEAEITATRSESLKVKTVPPSTSSEKPKPEEETTGEDPNIFLSKTNVNLIGVQGSAGVSAFSKTFSNHYASFTVSALGADASGQAGISVTHDGITAQASGNAGVYLVDAKAAVQAGPAQASGEASVGANANANAQVALNPLKGDVGVNGGVGAFAGAQADETAGLSADGTSATETANVGAGIGLDAKADFGIDKGKIDIGFDVGAYLGVGASADINVSVNVPKVVDSAWHAITSIF